MSFFKEILSEGLKSEKKRKLEGKRKYEEGMGKRKKEKKVVRTLINEKKVQNLKKKI